MNGVIHPVKLEMNKPAQKVSLSMRRGDTSTQHLRITLSRNGAVLDLSEAVIAVFKATKPDGTKVYNDCTISGNEIFLSITNQTIIVAGEVLCNVEVTFRNDDTLTSPEFFIYVYDNQQEQDEYVESTNEYRAAAVIVSTSTENADRAEAAAQSCAQAYEGVQERAAQVQDDKDTVSEKSAQAIAAADRADLSAQSAASSAQSASSAAATAAKNAAEQAAANIVEEMEGLVGQASEYARQALVSETNAESAAEFAQSHAEYAKECKTEAEEAASNANTAEQNAFMSAASASNDAEVAEAYANDAQLHDSAASTYADWAHDWAVGPTGSGSATDTNNAKYWSDLAAQYAAQFGSAVKWKESIYFASIPTTGMQNGDFYNIKDAFTTDSRFEEGPGISVLPGADIVWGSSISKWNVLTPSVYPDMQGATASAAGAHGLVPGPAAGDQNKYLRGDGSWGTPQDTTYSAFNTTTDGLTPKSGANTDKYLKGDGTWSKPQDTTYSTFNTTTDGLTPKSGANTDKYLKGDGTWSKPQDTTYSTFNTTTDGLVPKSGSNTGKYLKGDGTWDTPLNTNVTQTNTTSNTDKRILLSSTANDTASTSSVYKSSKFTANPSTGKLHAPTLDSTNLIVGNVYASVEAARLAITGSASGTWPEGVEFYVQSGGGYS